MRVLGTLLRDAEGSDAFVVAITRASLNSLAGTSGIVVNTVYRITDEARLAVGLTTSTYETFAKESEAGGVSPTDELSWITITDGTSPAYDWTAGFCFTWTLAANRTLPTPSNPKVATTRYILLKGSSTTDRTLSYSADYKGDLPTITTIDSGRWFLLTVVCIDATHFAVSSIRAFGTA